MGKPQARGPHLMMSVYSRSLPLLSFHFLYITEASTLAGEKVLGSLRSEITLSRMVLGEHGVSRYRALSDPPPKPEHLWRHPEPGSQATPRPMCHWEAPRHPEANAPLGPQPCRRQLVLLVCVSSPKDSRG